MADKKEVGAEELTDEELNSAAGGADFSFHDKELRTDSDYKKCANPSCMNKIPRRSRSLYCQTCAPLFEGNGN